MSTHVCTHMSSWCLVAQLPRTLPRGAPLRILALARCRRCLCPLAHSDPSARSRMARPAAVRVFRVKKTDIMVEWQDGLIEYDSGLIGSKMDSSLESA